MRLPRPFRLPVIGLIPAVVLLLAACAADVAPTPSAVAPVASADPQARDAFNAAICPIFTAILAVEPQLAGLREAGASGDAGEQDGAIAAASADLRSLLSDLEAVPTWSEGADLRFQLITRLHAIRAQLLSVDEPGTSAGAETLAGLPLISSEAMDRAMQQAVRGGLTCEGAS